MFSTKAERKKGSVSGEPPECAMRDTLKSETVVSSKISKVFAISRAGIESAGSLALPRGALPSYVLAPL